MNNKERTNTKKKEHNQHNKQNLVKIIYYFNITDALIIPMIFIFLPCREKAHDDEEFSRKNLKPCHESRITTR